MLQCRSLAQSLLKGRYGPIWFQREPKHLRLSMRDGIKISPEAATVEPRAMAKTKMGNAINMETR